MTPKQMPFLKIFTSFALFCACIYSTTAYAQISIPDIATMIKNLSDTMPNLMKFITAMAYVLGMWFIFKGILELKQYGESRSMMSTSHSLKGPLIYLFVGGALLYLPTSVQVGLSTFWEVPTPYAYEKASPYPWDDLIKSIFMIVQLIGTIAFIRGLIILTHLSQQGQPGTFGRAMAHIIGGILCINIYQFIEAVKNTLGIVTNA